MRLKIYSFLVNRHTGIRERYHRFHDGSHGITKFLSWLYLLGLNFAFHICFMHFLGKPLKRKIYEEKWLPLTESESEEAGRKHLTVEQYVEQLSGYDVISIDIFDTLLLRPFSEPTDLFFFIGKELDFLNFKQIRIEQEMEARAECWKKYGHTEITLADIWKHLEAETGIPARIGSGLELSMEKKLCYGNPFMKQVFQRLCEQGKTVVLTSDMYLPGEFLMEMLKENGFAGAQRMFLSCEQGTNKASGGLYELVKKAHPGKRLVHVGDNPHSDGKQAKRHGLDICFYPNCNRNTLLYRSYDMSPVVGGAYRGVVNNWIYNGLQSYSMEYEYGFIYGGIFVLGYCNFIYEYCRSHGMDKILFLSRDGDILKQVYDRLYPGERTEYAYWSRAAATKLMAEANRQDYFRRFLYHKVNQGYTIGQILETMELETLSAMLKASIREDKLLTDQNVKELKIFLLENWELVQEAYEEKNSAAKAYYAAMLKGCKRVCAVDIGWAGSGAISLDYLVERIWNLPCEVIGIVAGTNTVHNVEWDASEIFLQSGKLVSYLFSQMHNRDLMRKHDLNKNYNVFWELLLSSPTRNFKGFSYNKEGKTALSFGTLDVNPEGMLEIQKGILDFAEEYRRHFQDFRFMENISGRDAYAPMLVAASYQERYLKEIEKRFSFDISVN